jgi:E3 ubiquitin-protein ligase DOA10
MPDVVPTVDDLRTKLCYICREEEDADAAAASAAWVHPCGACALVAHEDCLLQWMRSAQQSEVHAAKALVCPQ